MKGLTLAVGVLLITAGVTLILFPGLVPWLAQHPLTSLEVYASAVIRIAIGLLLISVARGARVPGVLRMLGGIALIAGVATLFIGIDRAQAIAAWTSQRGAGVVRLFGLLPVVLGVLVVYACGPVRRAV